MTTPNTREYEKIRFDNAFVQAEFDKLVAAIIAAEQARAPLEQQERQAEGEYSKGKLSSKQFGDVDSRYIAAGNKIAAAKKAVDAFLRDNRNYRIEK